MGRSGRTAAVALAVAAAFGADAALAVPAGDGACRWHAREILDTAGEVRTGGLTGRLERTAETGSGRSKETSDLGIGVTRRGFDGHLAWSQDMSGGVHDLNSGFARALAVSMAWLDGRQGCPPSAAAGMALLGPREEGDRRFAAWRASPPGGTPFELWYDGKTGLLDRAFFQMAESRLIRHFADWRDVGSGRLAAFEQRDEYPEDEDEVVVRLAHADVRPKATTADFARPAPPRDATIRDGRTSTTVPYADDHRTRTYVPVYLNGKGPFTFELDNGGHNILTTETADAIGLTTAGSFNATGAGNAVSQSGIARIAELRIGDAVMTDQPVRVRKLSAEANDRSPNPPRAGILGLELFERYIIAIDRQEKTVTLSRFGSMPHPKGTPVPLVFAEDAPLVAGSYQGRPGDFMLDTGNAGATIIEDCWAAPLGLTQALATGTPRGDARYSKGDVALGPFRLSGELVSYYGPALRGSEYTRAVAGIYGEPLLSRFDATYDYSRGTVWLDRIPDAQPVPFDRSGLTLTKADGGALTVAAVMPDSPAEAAGFKKGDRVTAIDGKPASAMSRADAAALLRGKVGSRIVLGGRFGDKDGTKSLILREMIRN